jgi:hypothetical protein
MEPGYPPNEGLGFLYEIFDDRIIGKGKAIPLQDWTGPEGSRRF